MPPTNEVILTLSSYQSGGEPTQPVVATWKEPPYQSETKTQFRARFDAMVADQLRDFPPD